MRKVYPPPNMAEKSQKRGGAKTKIIKPQSKNEIKTRIKEHWRKVILYG
jgi:hypothetical protein